MNTYLIPIADDNGCHILKVYANGWDDCKIRVMDKYVDKFDDDDLSKIDDFEEFCDYLAENYDVIIGDIHELEEFE